MFQQQNPLKSQLQSHQSANRQLFQCEDCGKQYNTQLGYRRHLVAAHGSASAATLASQLSCPEGVPALLEHLGSHTDRPPPPDGGATNTALPVRERKYSCERCDRRFYTRKDVRRHAVVHTGRRDFLCPRCAQRFGRRDHLTRHLKKSHAQEAGMSSASAPTTPVTTPNPATPLSVKEELSPVACDMGIASKEPPAPPDAFSMDVYSSYSMANAGMAHHPSGLMQGPLSVGAMGVGRHMPSLSPHHHHHHHHHAHPHHHQLQPQHQTHHGQQQQQQQQQQPPPYGNMSRYQHGSTSYTRTDMESFLMDLQSAPLPPSLGGGAASSSTTSSSASPQREVLSEVQQGGAALGAGDLLSRSPALSSAELSCAANMDLGPLLGFLPFGLPPYSAHMGMGGLVMGYPSSSAASSSPSPAALPSQASGPFTLLQPPQGPGAHNHSQLPQGYSSPAMSTSNSLPRYYQAFQQ